MQTIVYLSASCHLFTDDELVEILTKSRLKNSPLGITGMLLYNDGSILQILEGEETVVRNLFDTIKKDNRHKGLIKMFDCKIASRNFSEWSMGFKQLSNEDWSELNGHWNLADMEAFSTVVDSADQGILAIIKSFTKVNRLNYFTE